MTVPSPLPRWARAADALVLFLIAAAVIVAFSGGFRVHIGSWPIAVRSPLPLLVWIVLVALVRHVAAPQSPIYRDLPRRVAAAVRQPGVRQSLAVVAGTRPAIFFVGYLAIFLFGYAGGAAPLRMFDSELMNLPVRWDTGWYLDIAINGYSFKPNEPQLQQNIVFFPAYPMAVRAGGRLLGGSPEAYIASGVVLSLLALAGALVYLYAFARELLPDEDARDALWLIAAYPFALFFGLIYTESLFLLVAVAAFYHFRRGELGRAALWGLVAGLTRPNGCFLSVPLAVLAVSPWLPRLLAGGDAAGRARPPFVKAIAAAAAPGIGMLIYAAFVWRMTGDPLAWAEGHAAWGRTYQGLTALVTKRYAFLEHRGLEAYASTQTYDLLNALGVIFVLATTWPVYRRLGLAYAVFILVNILPPLAAGGLMSAGRFSAVLFPSFVWLASAVPARQRTAWIATFSAVQAFNAALFFTWRPLF